MSGKKRYTNQFKKQIVSLYNDGNPSSKIIKEYSMTRTSIYNWIKKYNSTGSFKTDKQKKIEDLTINILL